MCPGVGRYPTKHLLDWERGCPPVLEPSGVPRSLSPQMDFPLHRHANLHVAGSLLCLALAFASQAAAQDQSVLLRKASELIPAIDSVQQPSIAANIAGQQSRAGNLADALATVQLLTNDWGRNLARSSIAYGLCMRGNLPKALQIMEAAEDGVDKANGYLQMAQPLAERKDFAAALAVAHKIDAVGEPAVLVNTLLRIAGQQWKADDQAGASHTADEALNIIERGRAGGKLPSAAIAGMYQQAARQLTESGQQARAAQIVSRIRELFQTAGDSGTAQNGGFWISSVQAAIGDLDGALETALTLPRGNDRELALHGISLAAAQLGALIDAQDIADRIFDQTLRQGALREIANARARSGYPSEALAIIDDIPGAENRAFAYAQLAIEQAQMHDPSAVQTVELAYSAALSGGAKTEHFVFECITVTKALLGDFSGALSVLNVLKGDSRTWPLWNLTEMLVAAGRKQEAFALADGETEPQPKAYALLGLASQLIKEAEDAEAKAGGRP